MRIILLHASRVLSPLSINNGVVGEDSYVRDHHHSSSTPPQAARDDWYRKNPRRIITKSCAGALAQKVLPLRVPQSYNSLYSLASCSSQLFLPETFFTRWPTSRKPDRFRPEISAVCYYRGHHQASDRRRITSRPEPACTVLCRRNPLIP